MAVINGLMTRLVLPSVSRSTRGGADLSFRSILSGNISYERLAGSDPSRYGECSRVVGWPGHKEDRVGHDTMEGLPATVAHSRRAVGARRVPADYRPSTRSRPGRSGAHHLGFALATVLITLGTLNGLVQAGGPPPVVVDSIEPTEIVQGQVPQPEIQVFGSNFIEGLPSETNRPTVTLRQQGKGGAEFSALAWVNFQATVATVPADIINLLTAPLGVYDVIVTRPTDNASGTLEGAFTVTDGEPEPGEIALLVRSVWGGPVNDVEVVGNLAYAAIGRRLVILNISDPSNPTELGSLNLGGVNGLAVRDGYAFVGANDAFGFSVVDVSDPSNPNLVWAKPGSTRMDVHLWGDFAFVRGHTGSVQLFDLTDPQNTAYVDSVVVDEVGAMVIVGDLMFVGTDVVCCLAELKIYDLASDPVNPVLLGSVDDVGKKTTALTVEGDYAYWTVRHEGDWFSLEVVDVSVPESPTIVASETGFVWARDVAVSGGYAYVADATTSVPHQALNGWASTMGLGIFDVSDPTNPTLVSTFKTHGNVTGVEVVANRAYVHDDGEGLIILDVTDPTKPVRLGNYHSPAAMRQMVKVGDLLYVADAWNGFTVLDVSDALHPQVVGLYLAEHYKYLGVDASGIDVRDNLVYLGAGHLGLEVVDVSDPAYPAFVGAFRIPPPAPATCSTFAAVTIWGDDPRYASIGFEEHFCFSVNGVFLNVDVTNPQDMFEAGRFTPGPPRASKIELNSQGIAFLGRSHPIYNSGQELTVDPSIPGPVHWGEIELVSDTALASDEPLLYLASSDGSGATQPSEGLYIQDVTDPANPVVLLHLNADYLFEDGNGNTFFLSSANAVATQNHRVYVAAGLNGPGGGTGGAFGVLDMADPTTPVLLDFVRRAEAGGPYSAVYVDEPHVFVTNASRGTASAGLAILELVGLLNPADLDGDGSVGVKDLLILLGDWGPCDDCTDCPADLDGDCTVGVKDLLILLGNWG